MISYNFLLPITLAATLVSCSNKKNLENNVISIQTTPAKAIYQDNEQINFTLNVKQNATIDSVAYYIADKKIGTVANNETLSISLKANKLGKSTLKAIAYQANQTKELSSPIEISTHVVPTILPYTLINTFEHDQQAYTQGLEFHNGNLYESTGNGEGGGTTATGMGSGKVGVSSIRQVDYKTGKVIKIQELPTAIFGEGCTVLGDKVYQLSWKHNVGYIYQAESLEKIGTFNYFQKMEGWGLANDAQNLYMSDGTNKIYKIDPISFEKIDEISIYNTKKSVQYINELEYAKGKIFANVYGSNIIVVIDPATGAIQHMIDCTDLLSKTTYHPERDFFNGIAYNSQTDTFFVTGKNWDKIFEIKIEI